MANKGKIIKQFVYVKQSPIIYSVMTNVCYVIILLCAIHVVAQANTRQQCKRKQYTPIPFYYHVGRTLAVYEGVPLKACIIGCRTYLECHGFNMRWTDASRTIGTCTLLWTVDVQSSDTGATYDESYTYYCKFHFRFTYDS